MSTPSPAKVRHPTDNKHYLTFMCPGCEKQHTVKVHVPGVPPSGAQWDWNGSYERPTFAPSVLVTWPANPNVTDEFKEWRAKRVCHSFVRDGRIQFLNDCTHSLAGQTVDLPDFES